MLPRGSDRQRPVALIRGLFTVAKCMSAGSQLENAGTVNAESHTLEPRGGLKEVTYPAKANPERRRQITARIIKKTRSFVVAQSRRPHPLFPE
jgi:hypothetical protein